MSSNIGFWEGIREVASGRGHLRLILQPAVSIILGMRLGVADAKEGKDPFLMRMFVTGKHRAEIAKQALGQVILPLTLAVVLDGVLQYLTLGYVRPLAAIVVGMMLIALPFSIARSLTNRAYRHGHPHASTESVPPT